MVVHLTFLVQKIELILSQIRHKTYVTYQIAHKLDLLLLYELNAKVLDYWLGIRVLKLFYLHKIVLQKLLKIIFPLLDVYVPEQNHSEKRVQKVTQTVILCYQLLAHLHVQYYLQ